MNKTTKTILIVAGIMVILGFCCCVGSILFFKIGGNAAMNSMMIEDHQKALDLAYKHLDFELPDDYDAQGAINMVFAQMILIGKSTGENMSATGPTFIIFTLPDMVYEGDAELYRVQMEAQVMESMGCKGIVMHKTGDFVDEINGKDVNFMTFEGTDDQGNTMKSIVSDMFEGKKGPVMLFVMGDVNGWDQVLIDQFIGSIH